MHIDIYLLLLVTVLWVEGADVGLARPFFFPPVMAARRHMRGETVAQVEEDPAWMVDVSVYARRRVGVGWWEGRGVTLRDGGRVAGPVARVCVAWELATFTKGSLASVEIISNRRRWRTSSTGPMRRISFGFCENCLIPVA